MEIKQIKLNIEMSPRASDELKALYTGVKGSKYELPSLLFPEDKFFTANMSIVDGLVWINIICMELSILLKGKLDGTVFHCRSVSRGSVTNGKMFAVCFSHKTDEEIFHVNPQLKKRLDMWYDYIDNLLKKSKENSYTFIYVETIKKSNENIYIRVNGNVENPQIKNLSVGIADEKGEPSFIIGKAVR
jgi:mRNA-degrading endonuclease HigB of HigAB toxin-antitoxin module